MRDRFPGYYRPADLELKALWGDAVFVPDASVLLNIYEYSEPAREKLLALFDQLKDRLWIPYQFAAEFHSNRVEALTKQAATYKSTEDRLRNILDQELSPKEKHPFIPDEMLTNLTAIVSELVDRRARHEKLLTRDPYLERIDLAIGSNVGEVPTKETLESLHALAKQRYAASTPPGYADVKEKDEPDSFGDCVGWLQILDYAANQKKSIVLLIDDNKEDWWYKNRSKRTIGPRPELIEEFMHRVPGQRFYMHSSAEFLYYAQVHWDLKIDQSIIEEVAHRREVDQEAAVLKSSSADMKSSLPAADKGDRSPVKGEPEKATAPDIHPSDTKEGGNV